MKNIKPLFILISALCITIYINAQTDLTRQVPVDPEIKTGRLENGLTYFIKFNKEPEKRASFYFIQNVGAILENDNENGLAHFLEHMAFNGTQHFPGKTMISSLEKHGVAFSSNINAYTGLDETVYNLSDVPVDSPGLLDSCLLIMYDWSDYVSLSNKEIDAERPVIIEEWRTTRNADFRLAEQYLPVLMKDSKYAVRDVIGNLDVINNFSNNTLRNFYYKWYRPDFQAVAVVGDFNASEMEKKVKDLFSQLRPVENPLPRPVFDLPFHKETLFVLATDKEASQISVDVFIIRKAVDPSEKNLGYLREQLGIRLMNSMMGTRINDLLQKGTPPFVSGSIRFSELIRGYDALNINATAKPNQEEEALQAIYTEAERAKRSGFTNAELERAKANLLTSYDNYYKQKDKIPNDSYISEMQNYFLAKEPLTSVDFEYEFVKKTVPAVTVEEISDLFKNLMSDENRVIIIQGQEGIGIKHLSEADAKAIIRRVQASDVAPYQDAILGESLINETLSGSKIIKTVDLKQFDAVEWTLANNAKVVYKKADYEKDNVILTAYSLGGSSLYETDMLPSASMLPLVNEFGVGDYDNTTLHKMLAGKEATATVSLGEITEGINGSSTPRDFETMMQLMYLRFEKPRFDKEAHSAIMTRYKAYLSNMVKDPSKIMQDSVSLFLTNFSPRTIIQNNEMLEKVDLEKIRQIYSERFRNASGFTFFIVGNIDEDTAKLMVEKYIGSLHGYSKKEIFIDRNVRPPKGRFVKDIQIPLAVPKATVFISHSTDMKYKPYNNLCLKVINGILDIVFTEKVREEAGGTYGVSMLITSQMNPYPNASGLIMFDCDPAKANSLKEIIYNEIDKLIQTGPSKENLDKAVSNMLKNREESKLHNNYWSNALYSFYYTGINVNDPENYEDILKKLTVKDIQKIAKLFFSKADISDIVFRPENQ
jgi:zinc protease